MQHFQKRVTSITDDGLKVLPLPKGKTNGMTEDYTYPANELWFSSLKRILPLK